jgi:molybdopterin synthase sulfur carrier subunit
MVIVHYWAAARAAAGCAEQKIEAGTVGELVAAITREHEMDRVLTACSLLVDGVAARIDQPDRVLADGATVDVLPPFAGG